jgi:hypothetical protein
MEDTGELANYLPCILDQVAEFAVDVKVVIGRLSL